MKLLLFKYNEKQNNINYQLFKYIAIVSTCNNFLAAGRNFKTF